VIVVHNKQTEIKESSTLIYKALHDAPRTPSNLVAQTQANELARKNFPTYLDRRPHFLSRYQTPCFGCLGIREWKSCRYCWLLTTQQLSAAMHMHSHQPSGSKNVIHSAPQSVTERIAGCRALNCTHPSLQCSREAENSSTSMRPARNVRNQGTLAAGTHHGPLHRTGNGAHE